MGNLSGGLRNNCTRTHTRQRQTDGVNSTTELPTQLLTQLPAKTSTEKGADLFFFACVLSQQLQLVLVRVHFT